MELVFILVEGGLRVRLDGQWVPAVDRLKLVAQLTKPEIETGRIQMLNFIYLNFGI